MIPSFKEWLKMQETSPIDRSKRQLAFGLPGGDTLAPASLNSRSTINPGYEDLLQGKDSHYDKKSGDKLDKLFHDEPKIDKDEYMKSAWKHKHGKKHEK